MDFPSLALSLCQFCSNNLRLCQRGNSDRHRFGSVSIYISINNWVFCLIFLCRFIFFRYAAIIHPLGGTNKCLSLKCRQLHEKRSRKLLSILAIWLVGIAAGSVQFLFTRVVSFPFGDRILFDCRESLPEHYAKLYTIFLFLSTFLVPLLILVYVYSIIGYQVWRHVAPGNPHHLRDHSNSLTRDKVSTRAPIIINQQQKSTRKNL